MKHRIRNGLNEYYCMVFKDAFGILKKGGAGLLFFELIYKMSFIAVFYPVLIWSFNFTLKAAGLKFLTNDYLFIYFKNPVTVLFIAAGLLIIAFYTSYEVSCLSVCFDAAHHGIRLTASDIFKGGIKVMRASLKKKKINTLFHITVISLMMNITLFGFFLSNIKINSTAVEIIKTWKIPLAIVGLLTAVLFVYCMLHIFTMNYVAYDGDDITDSKRQSRLLIRRRGLKTFGVMLGWNVIVLFAIYALYFIIALLIIAGVFILDKVNLGMAIYLSVFRVALTIIKILMPVISLPVSYAVITGLFFRYRGDTGNELFIGDITESLKKKHTHSLAGKVFTALLSLTLIAVNVFYLFKSFRTNPFYNVEYLNDATVTAHRGCSCDAPENTMAAFRNAVEATADYIELDVHETKDGVIVVMHDDSLYRTTGINRKIYNVTYDEIKELDAGSWFSDDPEFAECRIPTLEEVMAYTSGKIKLNIEIKLSDSEPDLVRSVAELIEKYGYTDECYVTSMNYDALTEIKEYNENIRTGYILTMAYGDFYTIDDVDAFSINMAYIDKNVIDEIHSRGKQIFAWTVNDRETARKLTVMGVDSIITDYPVMAREVVYDRYSHTLIGNVLSSVFKK